MPERVIYDAYYASPNERLNVPHLRATIRRPPSFWILAAFGRQWWLILAIVGKRAAPSRKVIVLHFQIRAKLKIGPCISWVGCAGGGGGCSEVLRVWAGAGQMHEEGKVESKCGSRRKCHSLM